jgi:hypothetical protein
LAAALSIWSFALPNQQALQFYCNCAGTKETAFLTGKHNTLVPVLQASILNLTFISK